VSRPRGRIKKSGRASLELELEPTADVLAGLALRRRDGQTLVGFAAEHGERAIECARKKLTEKGLDAVVVNDISREDIGFEVDANEVTILTVAGEQAEIVQHVPRAPKTEVAEAILDAVERCAAEDERPTLQPSIKAVGLRGLELAPYANHA